MKLTQNFPYKLSTRPSKTRFYLALRNFLILEEDLISADVASKRFDNLPLFNSDIYIGIDINRKYLMEGYDNSKEINTNCSTLVAIQSDLSKGLPLSDNTIDKIACTHTLSHICSDEWPEVISELIRILKPGGKLVVNFPTGSSTSTDLEIILNKKFRSVRNLKYRNRYSQYYENLMVKYFNRKFTHPKINRTRFGIPTFFIVLASISSMILVLIEYFNTSESQMSAYFCRQKL